MPQRNNVAFRKRARWAIAFAQSVGILEGKVPTAGIRAGRRFFQSLVPGSLRLIVTGRRDVVDVVV
jgi:hypothetical protein